MDADLTAATLWQFFGCVACYFIGALVLSRETVFRWLLVGMLAAFAFCLVRAVDQRLVEFPQSHQMLVEGERDGWTNVPPEMLLEMKRDQVVITTNGVDVANPVVLKKFAKGRVMGTLVYPNALAGAILLLLPLALTLAFGAKNLRPAIRAIVIAMTCLLGGAGFFWTGSKLGWLIAMGIGGLYLLPLELAGKIKNCRACHRRDSRPGHFRCSLSQLFCRGRHQRGRASGLLARRRPNHCRKILWLAPGRALSSGLTRKSNRRTPKWPGLRTTITSNNFRIREFPAEFFTEPGLFSRS